MSELAEVIPINQAKPVRCSMKPPLPTCPFFSRRPRILPNESDNEAAIAPRPVFFFFASRGAVVVQALRMYRLFCYVLSARFLFPRDRWYAFAWKIFFLYSYRIALYLSPRSEAAASYFSREALLQTAWMGQLDEGSGLRTLCFMLPNVRFFHSRRFGRCKPILTNRYFQTTY